MSNRTGKLVSAVAIALLALPAAAGSWPLDTPLSVPIQPGTCASGGRFLSFPTHRFRSALRGSARPRVDVVRQAPSGPEEVPPVPKTSPSGARLASFRA